MSLQHNWYAVLGLDGGATDREIADVVHQHNHLRYAVPRTDEQTKILKACNILGNPDIRPMYDRIVGMPNHQVAEVAFGEYMDAVHGRDYARMDANAEIQEAIQKLRVVQLATQQRIWDRTRFQYDLEMASLFYEEQAAWADIQNLRAIWRERIGEWEEEMVKWAREVELFFPSWWRRT